VYNWVSGGFFFWWVIFSYIAGPAGQFGEYSKTSRPRSM